MHRKARQYSNAEIRGSELVPDVPVKEQDRARARGFVIAWFFALIFYFLEYAVRSSPSAMIPQLAAAFRTTALGVGSILVLYYYTYSITGLIAGAALDHFGAKRPVSTGSPKDAHLSMVYAGVRYVLPSTSGKLVDVQVPY